MSTADIQEADGLMDRGVGQYMREQAFRSAVNVDEVDELREFSYLRYQFRQHVGGIVKKFVIKL